MVVKRSGDPMTQQQTSRPRALLAELLGRWWAVLRHPRVGAFERQQAAASWQAVGLGLAALAVLDALELVYLLYGPANATSYSSLPLGPKVHLPQTPLLPLAALVGSVAQFVLFAGLLHLSARLLGGQGVFLTQAYGLALAWVPLMGLSDLAELIPGVGAWLGVLLRLYALYLSVIALAAAQRLTLVRAWVALLIPVAAGLVLGAGLLALVWPLVARLMT